jgi:predicted methyltransferase
MNLQSAWKLLLAGCLSCGSKPAAHAAPSNVSGPGGPPPAASDALASSQTAKAEKSSLVDPPTEQNDRAQREREKIESEHHTELARWTPDLHAGAKRLADTNYPSADAALRAVLASPHRQPGNPLRDKYRHPRETLEFFGFQPSLTVLEYGPGSGWYTELLAPALALRGKLIVTSGNPKGPLDDRGTLSGLRLERLFETSPELFGKVERILADSKPPAVVPEGTVDLVLVIRELHNMATAGELDGWLTAFHRVLKPRGILGIEDHRANPGADPKESAKQGYLPEAWVVEQVEAHGFKLGAKSEVNANPKDTKDYPAGVWALPPTYRLGDQDREKYAAIGESDRFTLRFVKVGSPESAPKNPSR